MQLAARTAVAATASVMSTSRQLAAAGAVRSWAARLHFLHLQRLLRLSQALLGAAGGGGALPAVGPPAQPAAACEAYPRVCSDGGSYQIQPAGLHLLAAGTMTAAAAPAYRRPLPGERYAYGGLSCVISAVITNPVDLVKIRREQRR